MTQSIHKEMGEQVLQTIRHYSMIQPGARVLLAVSGGIDSMVMLDVLNTLKPLLEFELNVCHVNHGLRGNESNDDERFVIRAVEAMGIPLTVRRFDPDEIEHIRKGNLESESRTLRYDRLMHTADELSCSCIATAHTLTDQAETVLHHLFRSTGVSGLAGIAPVRGDSTLSVIRPMLTCTRDQIEAYAKARGVEYRHDSMNEDETFTRIKIRKHVLPLLKEQLNPRAEEALGTVASIVSGEEQFWNMHIESLVNQIGSATEHEPANRIEFCQHVPAEQRRMIRHWLLKRSVDPSQPLIEACLSVLYAQKPQGEIHVSDDIRLYRRYDQFYFSTPHDVQLVVEDQAIPVPGGTTIPALSIDVRADVVPRKVQHFPARGVTYAEFDAERVNFPVIIRNRRDGDTFQPLGMDGHKKIKKLLQEAFVPLEKRDRVPIVCMGDEIAWVVGYAQSQQHSVRPETENVLRITITPVT